MTKVTKDESIVNVLDSAMRLGAALGNFLKSDEPWNGYNKAAALAAFRAAQEVYCNEILRVVAQKENDTQEENKTCE